MAQFSQIGPLLSKITSGSTRVVLGTKMRTEGLDEFHEDLKTMIRLLKNNLDELAFVGSEAVRERTIARMPTPEQLGAVERVGGGIWKSPEEVKMWPTIMAIMGSQSRKLGGGKAGFAPSGDLNSVVLPRLLNNLSLRSDEGGDDGRRRKRSSRKSAPTTPISPYSTLWQIIEFGTGIYADPHKRTEGHYKIPGAGGAWFIHPKYKEPKLLGQKGFHFLFPVRQNFEEGRADLEAARAAIDATIAKLFSQGGGSPRRRKGRPSIEVDLIPNNQSSPTINTNPLGPGKD